MSARGMNAARLPTERWQLRVATTEKYRSGNQCTDGPQGEHAEASPRWEGRVVRGHRHQRLAGIARQPLVDAISPRLRQRRGDDREHEDDTDERPDGVIRNTRATRAAKHA